MSVNLTHILAFRLRALQNKKWGASPLPLWEGLGGYGEDASEMVEDNAILGMKTYTPFTTSTEHGDSATTLSATLPINSLSIPVRPCVPITMMLVLRVRAVSTMDS